MLFRNLKICVVALAAAIAAPAAYATTFTVDAANSSVTLTQTGTGFFCSLTNCGVEAQLASGLAGTSFDLSNVGDSNTFDFLTFTGSGTGGAIYDITATLAFDPPSFSVTGGGSGGVAVFGGYIAAGALFWTDMPTTVVLADGSEVRVDYQGGIGFLLGTSTTTSASLTLESLPAAVPLPASGVLMMAGIGGLFAMRRKRRSAQV